jgi:NAD(P)-dependent dehydrogenase (short-subunit alcohol dehydrogenase family)
MSRLYELFTQAWSPPSDPKTSFKGKNVIVTGSNTGLGFEAALKFVGDDASLVILAVRNLKKGDHAKSLIEERTGKKDRVEVWQLDMNSYDSIQDFANRASALDHLDVAVLNAGVFMPAYEESTYGWEQTLQINTLSTALLGLLLLPKLKASKRNNSLPVLEVVTSGNYQRVVNSDKLLEAENLLRLYNNSKDYKASVAYVGSKLLVMYVMRTLARLAKSSTSPDGQPDVVVTSVCPGGAASDLARGYSGSAAKIFRAIFFTIFLRTTEQGARSLVSGVSLGEEAHGKFWQHDILNM